MVLFIMHRSGRTTTINVENYYIIEQAKELFYNKEGVPVCEQKIGWGNFRFSNNSKYISDYNLDSSSRINYWEPAFSHINESRKKKKYAVNKKKIILVAIEKHLNLICKKNPFNFMNKRFKPLTSQQKEKYTGQLKRLFMKIKNILSLSYVILEKSLPNNIFVERLKPFLTHEKSPYEKDEENIRYVFNQLNLFGIDKEPFYEFVFPEVVQKKKGCVLM